MNKKKSSMIAFPWCSECCGAYLNLSYLIIILGLLLMLKEVYQIHLHNYVHFQQILGGIHIHVIQWYFCN